MGRCSCGEKMCCAAPYECECVCHKKVAPLSAAGGGPAPISAAAGGGGPVSAPYARCSVEGCSADTNQRYDKHGAIAEHQETKLLFCLEHAVIGIRNKTIANWNFKEFGVDEENPPEEYDCLAINPTCDKCEMRLSMDDMEVWLKDPGGEPRCEDCLAASCLCYDCNPTDPKGCRKCGEPTCSTCTCGE